MAVYSCGIISKSNSYRIKSHVGKGQFGNVSVGKWKRNKGPHIEIAIKTLGSESNPDDKIKFLQEAAIMAQFKHPNVVQLYGIVSEGSEVSYADFFKFLSTLHQLCCKLQVMLIIELAHNGDLRNHLNSLRSK